VSEVGRLHGHAATQQFSTVRIHLEEAKSVNTLR